MTAHPAWQLPIFGLRVQRHDLFQKDCFSARNILDRLAWHGVRQEADEITGMAGPERHADLAVRLETADARPVPGARIDDHERTAGWINHDALGRHDAHQAVIDRPIERAAVHDQLCVKIKNIRRGFGEMLAILIAALAHDIPEQHGPLRRIDHVFHGGSKQPKRGHHG
jgi:hypothetical protein